MSAPVQNVNQFAMTEQLGVVDLRFPVNTIVVQIDAAESATLVAGTAVKLVDSAGGVPKVLACTANTDQVFGFINFDVKTKGWVAGDRAEVSANGNVIYLVSTTAIARGAQVTLDIATPGGVASAVATKRLVGYALDKAAAADALIRVMLNTPSFALA